eukprot:TRINITY_DN66788_c2_g7_i1.p3 TRINITY_DN66788_c2_g7~~TRINITY_DN66788_c2_g7_i1.p3  ORF type:complete len:142 (-),score=18.35 TRINITY_DN66788_c2_g7_i1:630-1055(-)
MGALQNIGAVVLGFVIGSMVNMAFVLLNVYVLYPLPEGVDMNNSQQMSAWVETLPTPAFIVVLLAHLGQSFVGASVAARFGSSHKMALAMTLGVMSLIGGILNAREIYLPTWMYVEFPLYLVVAYVAGTLFANHTTDKKLH